MERVSNQLASGDYIMAYSNRPWGSIVRLPERYPYSNNYYRALFSGELGYELVQGFTRYPELAGISFVHDPFSRAGLPAPATIPGVQRTALAFDLGYADENVTNYDRPLVLVWESVDRLSLPEVRNILLGDADEEGGQHDDSYQRRRCEDGVIDTPLDATSGEIGRSGRADHQYCSLKRRTIHWPTMFMPRVMRKRSIHGWWERRPTTPTTTR